MARFRVGTSGWNYRHWTGDFYPPDLKQRDWFSYYARHFDTVEINASFYREPSPQTYDRWREAAPDGFHFAVKAHRFLASQASDRPCRPARARRVRRPPPRRAPRTYPLPAAARFGCNPENSARLSTLLELLPRDLDHVVEFRHDSWYTNDTIEQLHADTDRPLLARHGR